MNRLTVRSWNRTWSSERSLRHDKFHRLSIRACYNAWSGARSGRNDLNGLTTGFCYGFWCLELESRSRTFRCRWECRSRSFRCAWQDNAINASIRVCFCSGCGSWACWFHMNRLTVWSWNRTWSSKRSLRHDKFYRLSIRACYNAWSGSRSGRNDLNGLTTGFCYGLWCLE
ncbi:unnamed protein product, partial [Larinioides sclopetarius]